MNGDSGATDTDASDCLHTCSGFCAGGRCIVVLAKTGGDHLAIDGSNAYWIEWSGLAGPTQLFRVPLAGTAEPVALSTISLLGSENGLTIEGTNLYLALPELDPIGDLIPNVMKMPVAGGNATPLVPGEDAPGGMTSDATHLYWATNLEQRVMKVPLAGGVPVELAATGGYPESVAVDGTSVYWGEGASDNVAISMGKIMKVPVGGGRSVTLATNVAQPDNVTVGATDVYFTAGDRSMDGTGVIMKVPLGGGATTTLVSGLNINPSIAIAIDDASLYYGANVGPGNHSLLMKMPLQGGAPTAIASLASPPLSIVIDATSVYFTDEAFVIKVTPK
jgi:hypothetical protein